MGPSDVHVQMAGVLEGGEMARDPGGSLRRSLARVSNGVGSGGSRRQSDDQARTSRPWARWQLAAGRKIAGRGCRKATPHGAGNRPALPVAE